MTRLVLAFHALILLILSLSLKSTDHQYYLVSQADTTRAADLKKKGEVFLQKDKLDSAIYYYNESRALYLAEQHWDGFIRASDKLSIAFEKNGELEKSSDLYDNTRTTLLHKPVTDTLAYIRLLSGHAEALRLLSKYEDSIEALEKVVSFLRSLDSNQNTSMLIKAYRGLAFTHGAYRALDKSLKYYDSALLLTKQMHGENSPEIIHVLNSKARTLRLIGKYEEALEHSLLANRIAQKVLPSDDQQKVLPLLTLANTYTERNESASDNTRALEYYNKGIDLLKRISDDPEHLYYPYFDYGYGQAYRNLKIYDSAIYFLEDAEKRNTRKYGKDFGQQGFVYLVLADIYRATKDYKKADEYINSSISNYIVNYGEHYRDLVESYMVKGRIKLATDSPRVAMTYFEKAIDLFIPPADSLGSGRVLNPDQLYPDRSLMEVLQDLAQSQLSIGRQENSLDHYRASLDTYLLTAKYLQLIRKGYYQEFGSKLRLNERIDSIYENGVITALEIYNKTDNKQSLLSAMKLADYHKYSLLLENIEDEKARQFLRLPETLKERELTLKTRIDYVKQQLYSLYIERKDPQQIIALEKDMISLQNDLESLIKEIERDYPEYYRLKYSSEELNVEQIQESLQKDQLILQYFIGTKKAYVFWFTDKKTGYKELEGSKMESQLVSILHALKSQNGSIYKQEAFNLYELLLKEVLDKNPAVKRLVIIPDGKLSYLPFEALLQNPPTGNSGFKNLKYLINNYEVSYHYSTALLSKYNIRSEKYPNSFIGFAPYNSLSDELVHSSEEVKNIASLLSGEVSTGSEATEYAFKNSATGHQIIHLASHGRINDENPLYSNLLFTSYQDSIEDGQLNTYELYNMKLDADLICLSACNTAVGKFYKGEGIMSLAHGFAYAGVPNLLISLWKVSDEPTKDIMTYFYEEIKNGHEYSRALHLAKLRYLKESDNITADPYYWSSFVLIGVQKKQDHTSTWALVIGLSLGVGLIVIYFLRKQFLKKNESL